MNKVAFQRHFDTFWGLAKSYLADGRGVIPTLVAYTPNDEAVVAMLNLDSNKQAYPAARKFLRSQRAVAFLFVSEMWILKKPMTVDQTPEEVAAKYKGKIHTHPDRCEALQMIGVHPEWKHGREMSFTRQGKRIIEEETVEMEEENMRGEIVNLLNPRVDAKDVGNVSLHEHEEKDKSKN